MIHPFAFYTALLAALAGAVVATLATIDAAKARKASNIAGRRCEAAKRWIEAQQIYAHCVEDELYKTRRALGARPGELAYEAATRRLGEKRSNKELS